MDGWIDRGEKFLKIILEGLLSASSKLCHETIHLIGNTEKAYILGQSGEISSTPICQGSGWHEWKWMRRTSWNAWEWKWMDGDGWVG